MKKHTIALLILSIGSVILTAKMDAAVITIGTDSGEGGNGFPFGVSSSTAVYSGQYQQIYASSTFSQPFQITSIAFSSRNTIAASINYNFAIGLGVTSLTPSSPGSSYSGSFVPVFSGILTAAITANASDFDLFIPVTPFLYDPSLGNLLLDVNVASATGSPDATFFSWDSGSSQIGRIFNSLGSPSTGPNNGLVTQFTGTAVPEPTTIVLSTAGIAVLLYRRKRVTRSA